jgi:hypothetical protein
VNLVNRANLSADALAVLDAERPRTATLLDLLAGLEGQSLKVVAVVTQDEFTHDVVLAWRDGLWLVYGAT